MPIIFFLSSFFVAGIRTRGDDNIDGFFFFSFFFVLVSCAAGRVLEEGTPARNASHRRAVSGEPGELFGKRDGGVDELKGTTFPRRYCCRLVLCNDAHLNVRNGKNLDSDTPPPPPPPYRID